MDTQRRRFLRGEFLTQEGRETTARRQQAQGPAPPWHRTHLARISHQASTATAQSRALPSVPSVGLLNIVSTTPARPSVANPSHPAPLNRLATNPGEKCGLVRTLCSSCEGHCAAACEADIIRVHDSAHRLAGVPYLQFETGGCTYCRACVEVCPMDLEIGEHHPRPRIGIAVLESARCLAWNGVICMSCLYSCPHQAIRRDARGRPSIVNEACLGCGMCISVCPQEAIAVHW